MANKHNYASRMAMKRQADLDARLLSERFPDVAGITVQMTYYQRGANPVLMVRTVNILSSSYARLRMECMIKGCDGGGYDLDPVVSAMVKTRKKLKKGSLPCGGTIDAVASDHASIDYEITIEYNRLEKEGHSPVSSLA